MNIALAGSAIAYTPNEDQLSRTNIELAAFDGEIGTGQIPVPDDVAAIEIAGGRAALIEETSIVLSDGFIIDQDRDRGPVPTGTARQYVYSVQDANALLAGFRVHLNQPSETDYARVLAFAGFFLPTADTTWVLNASTLTLPARAYDGDGGFDELITDCVEFTGKTLFLHDKADGSGRCLHYHLLTNGHTCGLTISDVLGEWDEITVWPPITPTRQRTSIDLVNDIKARDQSGRTYFVTDSASITAHDADGLQHQRLVDFEAGTQAELEAKANALLASSKDERDTYTCTIGPLDADALELIRVGDLIGVTSSVMGLTASTQRISHIALTVAIGTNGKAAPGLWMAALEMGAPVRRRSRIKPTVKGVVIAPGVPGGGGGTEEECCPPWDGNGTPEPGMAVINEFVANGDGTTTAWATAFPYQATSLRVWVQGINVSGEKTEDDPTTGDFSLSFAPLTDQVIRVHYTAA